jgi:hypothetical protein
MSIRNDHWNCCTCNECEKEGALEHEKTCCCSSCIKFGINQKLPDAPPDHDPACRCNLCGQIR